MSGKFCGECGKKRVESRDPSRKDVCRCKATASSRGTSREVVRAGAPVGNHNAAGHHEVDYGKFEVRTERHATNPTKHHVVDVDSGETVHTTEDREDAKAKAKEFAEKATPKNSVGMSVEEAKAYLAERAKLGAFGKTWDEIEKLQGGKLKRDLKASEPVKHELTLADVCAKHGEAVTAANPKGVNQYTVGQTVRFDGKSADGRASGMFDVEVVNPHSNAHLVTHTDKRGEQYEGSVHHIPTATVKNKRSGNVFEAHHFTLRAGDASEPKPALTLADVCAKHGGTVKSGQTKEEDQTMSDQTLNAHEQEMARTVRAAEDAQTRSEAAKKGWENRFQLSKLANDASTKANLSEHSFDLVNRDDTETADYKSKVHDVIGLHNKASELHSIAERAHRENGDDSNVSHADNHENQSKFHSEYAKSLVKSFGKPGDLKASHRSISDALSKLTAARLSNNESVKAGLKASGVSITDLTQSLQKALQAVPTLAEPNDTGGTDSPLNVGLTWVADVIAPAEEEGETWKAVAASGDGKLYQVAFKIVDGLAELAGEPKEVARTVDYEFVAAAEREVADNVRAAGTSEGVKKSWEKRHQMHPTQLEYAKAKAIHETVKKNAAEETAKIPKPPEDASDDEWLEHYNKEYEIEKNHGVFDARDNLSDAESKMVGAARAHLERQPEYRSHEHELKDVWSKGMKHHNIRQKLVEKAFLLNHSDGVQPEPNKASCKLNSDVVHCRASSAPHSPVAAKDRPWQPGNRVEFVYMPAGVHQITAGFRRGSVEMSVKCDEKTADAVQASLEQHRQDRPEQEAYGCTDHDEKAASFRIKPDCSAKWSDRGVMLAAYPTALGVNNVNGELHRSWSPSFTTDADYSKAVCGKCDSLSDACQCGDGSYLQFPDGVRGSASNPAEVTGTDFCVGTLTNKPAFHRMPAVKGSDKVRAGGTSEGAKKGWEDRRSEAHEASKLATEAGWKDFESESKGGTVDAGHHVKVARLHDDAAHKHLIVALDAPDAKTAKEHVEKSKFHRKEAGHQYDHASEKSGAALSSAKASEPGEGEAVKPLDISNVTTRQESIIDAANAVASRHGAVKSELTAADVYARVNGTIKVDSGPSTRPDHPKNLSLAEMHDSEKDHFPTGHPSHHAYKASFRAYKFGDPSEHRNATNLHREASEAAARVGADGLAKAHAGLAAEHDAHGNHERHEAAQGSDKSVLGRIYARANAADTIHAAGTSEGAKKGWEKRQHGDWVVHPKTGRRGIIDHVYEHDSIPTNEHGRLVQVDYGNVSHNHREGTLRKSNDQESKWADKSFESSDDKRQSVWDRMSPEAKRVAQSKDREDASARAKKNTASDQSVLESIYAHANADDTIHADGTSEGAKKGWEHRHMKTTLKEESAAVIRMLLNLESGKVGPGIDKDGLRDHAKRTLAELEKEESAAVIRMLLNLESGKVGPGIDKDGLRDHAKRTLAELEKKAGK